MRSLALKTVFAATSLAALCFLTLAQQAGHPKTQTEVNAPQTSKQACVIVKRHVHKFGENMSRWHAHRPFDYVEGDYPPGFKWRSELGDGDVRELQQKDGRMVVLRPDYQLSDLTDARNQCKEPTPPTDAAK